MRRMFERKLSAKMSLTFNRTMIMILMATLIPRDELAKPVTQEDPMKLAPYPLISGQVRLAVTLFEPGSSATAACALSNGGFQLPALVTSSSG